jgi:phage tail tape-measure protein
VDDEHLAAAVGNGVDEIAQLLVALHVIDTDAMLDGHGDVAGIAHRRDAVAHAPRFGHQAGTEGAVLYPVRGTAAVQVDLIEAGFRRPAGAAREIRGLRAAELQGDGMLSRIKRQEARTVAVDQGPGGDHFRVQPRATRQQPPEVAAVAVGPVHHWSGTHPPIAVSC